MSHTVYFRYKKATCKLIVWDETKATLSNLFSIVRNQGHAKGVLREACNFADENDLQIVLRVQRYGGDHLCPDNAGLKRLYSQFGFIDCGRDFMSRDPSRDLQAS